MNAKQLRTWREKQGLSQDRLAEILNGALDRRYRSSAVSAWELAKTPIPEHVSVFLDSLALGGPDAPPPPPPLDFEPEADRPPAPPSGQPPLTATGGTYDRACRELWELIGASVGMAGDVLKSPTVSMDGAIIVADSAALGKAWGKLAETNETFRKMLIGMTEGGAWLEVSVVTGTTVSKIWQNHQQARILLAREPEQPPESLAA